jgi:hypothetical protein
MQSSPLSSSGSPKSIRVRSWKKGILYKFAMIIKEMSHEIDNLLKGTEEVINHLTLLSFKGIVTHFELG